MTDSAIACVSQLIPEGGDGVLLSDDSQLDERLTSPNAPASLPYRQCSLDAYKFNGTPGSIRWTGPNLGEHNREIYGGLLGISDSQLEGFRSEGVI